MDRFKKYLSIIRGSVIETLSFRISYFAALFGNLIYLVIIYFLWKALFLSCESMQGLSFTDTFVYQAISMSMFNMITGAMISKMSQDILSGQIAFDFARPINYQAFIFCFVSGDVITAFIISFLPTLIIIEIICGGLAFTVLGLAFFIVSLIFATLINFCVDFIFGSLCFFTVESTGIDTIKNIIMLLLSGAAIPLAFFPESIQNIALSLPFYAIYYIPVQILRVADANKLVNLIITQLLWLVAMIFISRIIFSRVSKKLTINGG